MLKLTMAPALQHVICARADLEVKKRRLIMLIGFGSLGWLRTQVYLQQAL